MIPTKALQRKGEITDRNKEKHKRYEEHRPERVEPEVAREKTVTGFNYDTRGNVMTCSMCVDYYGRDENIHTKLKGQNRFKTGCSNRKISSVLE